MKDAWSVGLVKAVERAQKLEGGDGNGVLAWSDGFDFLSTAS